MTAEAVYLVLDRFLETLHDQERDDGGGKANRDADEGDLVDGGRESFLVTPANSFGYEIG